MKKLFVLLLLMLGCVQLSFAGSTQVDALIEKLVDKKILTRSEGIKLKSEVAADEKLIRDEGFKTGLPEWVQKTKLKGDFRLRYQYERKKDNTEARSRGRIRTRLGIENQINDQFNFAAGLASTGTTSGANNQDPRSTNDTFEDFFSRASINLDYAYAEYTPNKYVKLIGGKLVSKDYLWRPTDFIWDSDINPEGASIHGEYEVKKDLLTTYANSGVWLLEENSTADRPDPFMHYLQAGIKGKLVGSLVDYNMAAIKYGFNGLKGSALTNGSSTNTLTGGVLKYDYDTIGGALELGLNRPADSKFLIERLGVFAEYIDNLYDTGGTDVDEDTGWSAGVVMGDKKVANFGKWQFKYIYARLERDAFPDVFPDSDRYGGATDMLGHEAILVLGLAKNVTFSVDYYNTKRITIANNPEKVVQADFEVKF